jgi:hypothetical protein
VREDFVFRRVRRNGKTVMPLRTRAVAGGGREELPGMREAAINDAVQRACVGAPGREKGPIYSAHSLHCRLPHLRVAAGGVGPAMAHRAHHRSRPAQPVHPDRERLGGQRRHCPGSLRRFP